MGFDFDALTYFSVALYKYILALWLTLVFKKQLAKFSSIFSFCNPQSCVCEEGDSDLCIFCEREFIYLQSDNDGSSVVSYEDCASVSSRAGANSCIQSPEQHDNLSKTFGNTVQIVHSSPNDLLCLEVSKLAVAWRTWNL